MVGKKEEFWRNKQNGDFLGKTFFLKGLLTFFSKHLLSGKCFKKIDFLQKTDLWKKDRKAFFSFNKAIDVLKNIQGL